MTMQFQTQYPISENIRANVQIATAALWKRRDLGYLQLPDRDAVWSRAIEWAQALKKKSDQLVVIGLGGSALGGKALVRILGENNVMFLHNTDPHTVSQLMTDSKLLKAAQFLVISKSGSTLEIAALLSILVDQLNKISRPIQEAVSVVTEEKDSPLYLWAKKNAVAICPHALDVGGRFSVLSEVGLIPAAFSGVDVEDVRGGAQNILKNQKLVVDMAAYFLQTFQDHKSISVFWSYCDQLETFLPWLQQLWAESLGKKQDRSGGHAPAVSTPFAAMGASDQHSVLQQFMEGAKDKAILFIEEKKSDIDFVIQKSELSKFEYLKQKSLSEIYQVQSQATEDALQQAEVPVARLAIDKVSAESLGQLLMLFEALIGVLGEALNINAFDQPGVELGKKIAQKELSQN